MQRLPQRLLPLLAAVALLALPGIARADAPTLTGPSTVYVNQPTVALDWTPFGGELDYDLYGPDCPTPSLLHASLGQSTLHDDEALTQGPGTYCFQVVGEYAGPTSGPSNVVTVVYDTTPPPAPDPQFSSGTDIRQDGYGTSYTSNQVTLEWAPVDDGSGLADSGLQHYEIQRDDHDGNGLQHVAYTTGTSWSDDPTLAEGDHSYVVSAIDNAGNATPAADELDVIVDTTAPVVQIDDQPANPSPIYEDLPFDVSADDLDATLLCTVDGVSGACANGTLSFHGPVLNGSHTFEVTAVDVAGNTAVPVDYTWTVDSGTTGLLLDGPSGLTNQVSPAFDFSWAHPDATFRCQLDGSGLTSCSTGQSYGTLADGNHTFDLEATDPAGSTATQSTSFHLDGTAPTGTFDVPAPRVHGSVDLEAQSVADGDSGVTAVTYRYSGTASGTIGSVASGAVHWNTTAVPDGSYTVEAAIADAAGNTTPLTAQTVVDNSGPAGVVDGLVDGTILHGTGIAVTAHASDPAGVQSAQLQLGQNGTWQPLGNAFTGDGPYGVTWNTVRTDDGVYAIRLAATDTLGNTSYSAVHSVIVDNTVPSAPGTPITSASPTSAAPVIAWPASASPDVAGYDVYRAGQRVATGLTGTVYSDQLAADGSQDGAYAYTVSAVDRGGNESAQSAPVAVIYDRTAPAAPASVTATASPVGAITVSWSSASDPTAGGVSSGVAGYVLRRSTGEQVCTPAATVTTCTDGTRPAGTYTYAVYALDAAGNLSAAPGTATVTVSKAAGKGKDTTPPARAAKVDADVRGTTASVSWQNPKDRDFDHVVVVANAKHRPKTVKDGARLYSGKADSVAANGAPGTKLFLAVYAYDRSGNVSAPVYVTATFAPSALLPANGSSAGGSPALSWRGVARATYYNVQVFLGKKRVAVGWPKGTSFRVPGGKLVKGKTYTWYVWPGFGALKAAHYGAQVGHATFTYTG
jgi:fibronectin type 3 domain-containing protein